MKISSKLDFNFELKIQRNSKKKKKNSFLKKSLIWITLEILSILLEKLVAWIIKLKTNGPFYFYNRIFYLKESWCLNEK